jgi:hypothetical protein
MDIKNKDRYKENIYHPVRVTHVSFHFFRTQKKDFYAVRLGLLYDFFHTQKKFYVAPHGLLYETVLEGLKSVFFVILNSFSNVHMYVSTVMSKVLHMYTKNSCYVAFLLYFFWLTNLQEKCGNTPRI